MNEEQIKQVVDEVKAMTDDELREELTKLRQRQQQVLEEGVLQCYRCGQEINEGDPYADIAATVANCPAHEDYLDWSPDYEEYFCGDCWNSILNHMRGEKPPNG